MNRRTILKQLAMASTAAVLVPSCISDPKKVSIALKNLDIKGDEEDLLASLAETIIPETEKPGAKTVGAHLFTLVMVDDCTDKTTKDKFLKGLRSFEETCKTIKGKTFSRSNAEEKLELLAHLETNKDSLTEEVNTFYYTSRRFIIQGYVASQHFLSEVKPYSLVPGPNFKGCIPVTQNPTNV